MGQDKTFPRLAAADLDGILSAQCWEELRTRVKCWLAGAGIDDFVIMLEAGGTNGTDCLHLFGTLPDGVLAQFDSVWNSGADVVQRHIARSGLPLVWEVEQLCDSSFAQAYLALRAHGVRRGTSCTVRGPLAVSRTDFYQHGAPGAAPCACTADLLLLASYLHEAAHRLWGKQNTHTVPTLTEREYACLYWSAGGKTSKETAMILGISRHTVYFHLKNVASKFNVYSTRHAISRATSMGMIKPRLASARGWAALSPS